MSKCIPTINVSSISQNTPLVGAWTSNTTQTLTSNSQNYLKWNTTVYSNFGPSMTYDNPSNITNFINNTGRTVYWNVSLSVRAGLNAAQASMNLAIYKFTSSGTQPSTQYQLYYGQVLAVADSTSNASGTSSCIVQLLPGEYIRAYVYPTSAITVGSTSQTFAMPTLQIAQIN